ncbi:MAG: hypothetical protein J6X60_12020, partial [Ruminiclostridium sp.]|nr:hypothetical protein [Ruminiclostridium sp.]
MKYFLHKIRELRAFLVVFCLLALISYPLFCGALGTYSTERDRYYTLTDSGYFQMPEHFAEYGEAIERFDNVRYTTEIFMFISLTALAVMFAGCAAAAVRSFRYLYSRERADKELMIPVSSGARFIGDFFSGLAVTLIPHIAAVLTGIAILAAAHPVELKYDIIAEYVSVIHNCMIGGIIMCVELYCITVLLTAVCGKLSRVIWMTVFTNIALPVIIVTAAFISIQNARGMDPDLAEMPSAYIFMPGGFLLKMITELRIGSVVRYGSSPVNSGVTDLSPLSYAFIIIYCAALAAAAYFLIKHRRNERTGNAYVYKYARQIMSGIAVLSITFLMFAEMCSVMTTNEITRSGITLSELALSFGAGWLV